MIHYVHKEIRIPGALCAPIPRWLHSESKLLSKKLRIIYQNYLNERKQFLVTIIELQRFENRT